MLKVATRSIGRRKPLMRDFSVPPPEDCRDDGNLLLRHLIEHIVRHQVRLYNERQEAGRLDRVLTAGEIEEGARQGKIDPEGRPDRPLAKEDESVDAALLAFEDGMFLVIVDEVERRSLDEHVYLSPDSALVFLRLTFLAGG